jgi:hypothetical protein
MDQETLKQLLKELRRSGQTKWETVLKSVVTSSVPGTTTQFQPFNLDPVGKLLLPEFTPFQNGGYYGVKGGQSGDAREYRAIVGKNTTKHTGAAIAATSANSNAASSNGRASVVDYQFLSRKKTYAKYAPESAIDWELYRSSGPFNALGRTTIASLIVAKELEERHILGANSTALGTPATPTGVTAITGGSLTNGNSPYTVKVIALNYYGWWYWMADGFAVADITAITTFGLPGGAVQTESIGSAASAALTVASGSAGSIAVAVTPITGAFAYLWVIEHTGTYKFGTVSTTPFATIVSEGTLTVVVPSADGSAFDTDGYPVVWDGAYAQAILDADIPGEYISLAGNGTPGAFTTTGSGSGVAEVETLLQRMWTKWKSSPVVAVMSPRTLGVLSNVAIGSSAPAYRFMHDVDKGDGNIVMGSILTGIRNQYADTTITTLADQVWPDGKIFFYQKKVDYPDANVGSNLELFCTDHFLQDFFARTNDVAPPGPWAIKTYGAPILYWPRGCGAIGDIA